MQITHAFVSNKADSSDSTLVQPSNWNSFHTVLNGPVANVKDYGAVGDGVNDDTSAIVAALAANVRIYIPEGRYRITSTITVPAGAVIQGDGDGLPQVTTGTWLIGNFAGAIFFSPRLHGKNIFRGFVVDGSNVAGSIGFLLGEATPVDQWTAWIDLEHVGVTRCGQNIEVLNAWGVRLCPVMSTYSLGHGLWVHPPTTYPGGAPTAAANPPSGGYTTTILIDGHSQFDNNVGSGVFFDGSNNDVTLINSIFDNNGAIDAIFTGSYRSLRIVKNYFETLQLAALKLADGIALTGLSYVQTGKIIIKDNFLQGSVILGNNVVDFSGNTGSFAHADTLNLTTLPLTDGATYGVLGPELLTNGGFTGGGAGWAAQAGWSFAGNQAVAVNATGNNSVWQNLPATPGVLYKVTYTVTVTSGGLLLQWGNQYAVVRSVSGTYTEYIRATTTGVFLLGGVSNFNGTVDNVSLKAVTPSAIATLDFIASETGANNAIVGTLASGAALAIGLRISILLAHTLQAGANTFNYNGVGAIAIKKHTSPSSNLTTAYVVGSIIDLVYDGTSWQDMGQ